MVEENFGFWRSEMVQNKGFQQDFHRISSPWLKKILDFDDLKWPKMKALYKIFIEHLRHG
jgi:hypothetical protein